MWIVAICSYLFNRTLRMVVLIYFGWRKLFVAKDGGKWLSGTREMKDNLMGILLLYLIGPRWNCHVMLATLGPFRAKKTISIGTENLSQAESWTAVIYDRRYRTIATSEMLETAHQQDFEVKPDYYTVVFRYYGKDRDLKAPSVSVDSERLAEAAVFEGEYLVYNELLESIRSKGSVLYRFLQYYAFYLLKNEDSFSTSLVKKQFLPVGNPETTFYYGYLPAKQGVTICCESGLLDTAIVFLAIYNESSFPEFWQRIEQEDYSYYGMERNGAYLIRVVPKQGFPIPEGNGKPRVEVTQLPNPEE